MKNTKLRRAQKEKNDEFYTQYADIQKEIEAYLEYDAAVFRDKVVYCNCDDPYESNFFRYFALNFKRLGLKQLITSGYKPSPIANTQLELFGDHPSLPKDSSRPKVNANRFIINEVGDFNGDGSFNLTDVALQLRANKNNEWRPLKGNGDFRSAECIKLFKQADVVVTNPPFSLLREYVAQLVEHGKKFLILGSMNAITYKEIFPLIKENKMWLGVNNRTEIFQVPEYYNQKNIFTGEDGKKYAKMGNTCWFANLDHGRRHQPLPLMTMADNRKFKKQVKKSDTAYQPYDNYDAIEVPFTSAIPSDYPGVMGVPITFLEKFNPDQFEIIDGLNRYSILNGPTNKTKGKYMAQVNGRPIYVRIVIKHKNPADKK